ncbi:DNA-processing protein DprA [Saccharothrix sp. NPDC042600]|uniref:DNA-processing protein DprA n=1 Tax=Saccharothrix TaxID=2071 RepID=UPI0034032470|nr:hypothetical protein GCM10017745_18070 [Saccharothrix mutabilis subsp. capreolus]
MHTWDDDERAALVALLRTRPDGLTWSQLVVEVCDKGSARAVWDSRRPAMLLGDSFEDDPLETAMQDIQRWTDSDFRFHTFRDADYPAQLREVHQLPPVLFTKGTLKPGEKAVSVVGSRKASDLALRTTNAIAEQLVSRGVTVLSGLAEGIDTAAHTTALRAGGRTVAVIGTGILKYYPATNRGLQDRIASEGMVMSQFWPDSPPSKSSFPMRNATMSAYGLATIIVEAGEQSGARIQARSAVAHGRPVILMETVVRGTNWGSKLINQPGVFRAATPADAINHVEKILSANRSASEILELVQSTR